MAGNSAQQFANRMRIKARGLGEASNAMGARAAFQAGKYLVKYTPIDTGQAKSNWQASRVSPRTRTRPAYAKGRYDSTEAQNEAAAISQILHECLARTKNQQMFLTNNLPYISKLESSYDTIKRKRPVPQSKYRSGFFRKAVQIAQHVLRDSRMFRDALKGKKISVSVEQF
jgi:hypothetical protein